MGWEMEWGGAVKVGMVSTVRRLGSTCIDCWGNIIS